MQNGNWVEGFSNTPATLAKMWRKRTIQSDKNVSIKSKPGNNVFIANRGDVLFEYPASWIVKPSDNSICFYDAEPPADQCVLEFSIMQLQFGVDWSNLPLDRMLCSAVGDNAGPRDLATVQRCVRKDLKLVWLEYEFLDPIEKRTALTRCALALHAGVLPLITFSFWPEDLQKWTPFWNDLLDTLRLAQGPRFLRRN